MRSRTPPVLGSQEWAQTELGALLDECYGLATCLVRECELGHDEQVDFDRFAFLFLSKRHQKLWKMICLGSGSRPWIQLVSPHLFSIVPMVSRGFWDKAFEGDVHQKCSHLLRRGGVPVEVRWINRF